MKKALHTLLGSTILILLCLNTLIMGIPVIIFSILKLLPFKLWKEWLTKLLIATATLWMSINNSVSRKLLPTQYHITGFQDFIKNQSYLIICNHQSWLDIVALQQVFLNRIPFAKFFMKQELIYVPIIGLACWALDFPLMKRYSKAYLKKYPHKKGQDLQQTQRACQKFKKRNISVINFVEGTRFTQAKHSRQQSPFPHLLKPKAGGIAMLLSALEGKFSGVFDVTIHYPQPCANLWSFLCGYVQKVNIHIDFIPMSDVPFRHYHTDENARKDFQQWLNNRWQNKDELMQKMGEL